MTDILDPDNSLDGLTSNVYDGDLTGDDSALLDQSNATADETDPVSLV